MSIEVKSLNEECGVLVSGVTQMLPELLILACTVYSIGDKKALGSSQISKASLPVIEILAY